MTSSRVVLPIPYTDPVAAFAPFAGDPVAALLDSAGGDPDRGRYAYIAVDPYRVISAHGPLTVDGHPVAGDSFTVLADELAVARRPAEPGLPPFQGGAVGFFGYELGRHLERLPKPRLDDAVFPDMVFGLYDTIAAFDLVAERAWVMAVDVPGTPGAPATKIRPAAAERAWALAARIAEAPALGPVDWSVKGAWRPETARADYQRSLRRVIDYIHAGDIFQANLTQRFIGTLPERLAPFTVYRRLRELTPAPFAAFLRCGAARVLASASPERFLRLGKDGRIDTRPIKGTRPRGATPEEDADLADALLTSDKDRAENLMIVDLLRNDLSRVSKTGSVRVTGLCLLESFATVHHLVSVVEGQLRAGLDAIDLLRATFPGGSITGAPKIRAMEIIAELEPARRGPYCGSIAWLGFDGAMESSIVIRTVVIDGRTALAQAGGGIVADSDPAAEYDETITKARALLDSLDPRHRNAAFSDGGP